MSVLMVKNGVLFSCFQNMREGSAVWYKDDVEMQSLNRKDKGINVNR